MRIDQVEQVAERVPDRATPPAPCVHDDIRSLATVRTNARHYGVEVVGLDEKARMAAAIMRFLFAPKAVRRDRNW